MVDELAKDPSRFNDIETLRLMLMQLIESSKSHTNNIEQLTRTIEQLNQTIEQQTQTISLKDDEIRLLKLTLFGKKSERMTSVGTEVKRKRKEDPEKAKRDKEAADKARKENAEAKKQLPEDVVDHAVTDDVCCCPHCGGTTFTPMGFEESLEYEYVPSRLKKIRHRREKKACACKEHIVIAPPPPRVSEGVMYGPGLHANVIVAKCLDSIPFYRLSAQFERVGIPMARSTICDMFHRGPGLLMPIYDRIIKLIPSFTHINADETRIMVQEKGKCRKAFIWVFIAGPFVAYVFSPSRSGQTPIRVLGESAGILQVDGYSGYNQVTTPDKRTRAGCLGHSRRKFIEAKETAPAVADHVISVIRELYEVEYDAADQDILGTEKHMLLRQIRSKPLLEGLKSYLEEEQPKHLPKGSMANAIAYFIGNWDALSLFLKDSKIALDNNLSERQLRLIALGRKNYLFVGNDVAGQDLAIMQTLVATCVQNGVNPQTYLTDVLIRIQTHPQSRLDELLPNNWKPPPDAIAVLP